jgi:hypothetical protein
MQSQDQSQEGPSSGGIVKENDQDAKRQEWNHKFEGVVRDYGHTKKALERAIASHLSRSTFLDELYSYTRPNPLRRVGNKAMRIKMRQTGTRELKSTIKRLEKFKASFSDWKMVEMSDVFPFRQTGVGKRLERALDQMLIAIRNYKQQYDREPSLRGSERDESKLVRMVLQMENVGGRPAYSDVAYLVTAANHAHGKLRPTTPAAIKQVVKRFERNKPGEYNEILGDMFSAECSRQE